MVSNLAKFIIFLGLVLIGIGAFILVSQKIPWLTKLGKLPGDIHIKGEKYSFYFPVVTCIILSVFFTLIFYIIRRFIK